LTDLEVLMSDVDRPWQITQTTGVEPGATTGGDAALARLPEREEVLDHLVIVEHFVDDATCDQLVESHRRFGRLDATSDNALGLGSLRHLDPAGFDRARSVLARMEALIRSRFREAVGHDHAVLCALTAGGFQHVLHADNAIVICPQHGSQPEQLVHAGCSCTDIRVAPNHTPWRTHSALLYLSDAHTGGHIVFGEGPNVYGRIYRKELAPVHGLLVLFPSNELYFHHTTVVESGVRYSMNCWFTTDPDHMSSFA